MLLSTSREIKSLVKKLARDINGDKRVVNLFVGSTSEIEVLSEETIFANLKFEPLQETFIFTITA